MEGALWILVGTAVVGLVLWALDKFYFKPKLGIDDKVDRLMNVVPEDDKKEDCCGLHLVCEKESLSPVSSDFDYYDDEELDAYIGRLPDSYSYEEEEQFRDILLTLRPQDIAGWSRSLQVRGINLPEAVREELLMIVSEAREQGK